MKIKHVEKVLIYFGEILGSQEENILFYLQNKIKQLFYLPS